jgi:hypothetical protein
MKPDFVRMARDMADEVTKRPGDGIAALATMSETLHAAYSAGLERAAEIADAYEGSMMLERSDTPSLAAACEIADSIRAEKENDHD